METQLLDLAISAGLNITLPDYSPTLKNIIPSNCFGVFTTVRRYKKLHKWPEDIHGCIGYWDNNFNPVSKQKLLDHTLNVSYKATFNDDRRKYFTTPLHYDALSEYELDYMMKPIYQVSSEGIITETNEPFNNDIYGLIVIDAYNNRATYLPKVFSNKSWNFIKSSLIKKANSSNNIVFYAYKIVQYKKPIYQLMNQRYFTSSIYKPFINFINSNFTEFVPYQVENNKIEIDKSQDVRNIATITDIQKFNDKLTSSVKNNIKRTLKYYRNEYNQNPDKYRQSSAFLLLAINNTSLESKICNNLYSSIDKMDKRFELGECLIALAKKCPNKSILLAQQKGMYNRLFITNNYKIDDIFQYNWESKYLLALTEENIHTNFIKKHAKELNFRVNHIISKFVEDTIETNYLAVSLEALSSLTKILGFSDGKINKSAVDLNIVFGIFYNLQKRFNNKKGLYKFLDNRMRLDITGHVLNALELFN